MAAYDPYYADVVLLLRGNGDNDSQTITDERGHTVTVTGNTCIKTSTKKYGSGSIYFDGSGDYVSVPGTDFVMATGDFTMDCWIKISSYADMTILSNQGPGFGQTFRLWVSSAGYLKLTGYVGMEVTSNVQVPLDEFVYVAASRKSSVLRLYINQDKVYQGANTYDFTPDNIEPVVAGYSTFFGGYFSGYIDDLRFTLAGRYDTDTIRVPAFEAPIDNVPPDITLTSITPHKGPTSGGTLVTLAGSGFTDYTTCTIDGNSLTSLITVSDTELTGYTPPGTVGLKDVVVTNP